MLFPDLSLTGRALAQRRGAVPAWLMPYRSSAGAVPALVLDYGANLFAVNGVQLAQPVTGARLGPRAVDGLAAGLIVDPARTNLVPQSVATATAWTMVGSTQRTTLSDNALGLFPGLEVVSEGQNWHRVQPPNTNFAAGVSYSVSVWYRAGSSGRMRCILYNGATNPVTSVVLAGAVGAITLNTALGATVSNIENIALSGTDRLLRFSIVLGSAVSGVAFGIGPDSTVSGQSVVVHGMQVEQAAGPSGYIATAGAATTRTADAPVLPGTGWLAAGAGTLSLRVRIRSTEAVPLMRLHGATDAVELYRSATGTVIGRATGSTALSVESLTTVAPQTDVSCALAWSSGGLALSLAGGAVRSAPGSVLPALTQLGFQSAGIGSAAGPVQILRARYFAKRLSDAELQGLSA